MGHPVTLIEGNGIGPQITAAVRLAVDATGASIDWQPVRFDAETKTSWLDLDAVMTSVRATKTALMGPLEIDNDLSRSFIADLHKKLDLYASLKPVRSLIGIPSRFESVDLIVISGNLEDLLIGIEFGRTTREAAEAREFLSRLSGTPIREDSAVDVRPISVLGSYQILDFAFRHATVTQRKKVTVVHDKQTLKATDGLFLEIAREVAKGYPNLEFEDRLLGDVCLQLMQNHRLCDVLVAPTLYGNFLSTLCAGMVGGLHVAPVVNLNHEIAVFGTMQASCYIQAEHKSDPTALLLSAVLMLQHLGEIDAALTLQKALEAVVAQTQEQDLTSDSKESISPSAMAEAVVTAILQ
jgi:isocitrate dehydrogenase (NAD+)